eukprot:CAMPEP_0182596774 /NCGR_PEP_ID=MMETSP1324-20130603/84889_1 /TAXON_ID=236786 /ORGANISM="Florenciella sp., Strain RCC1587" /LENGTH=33 /DNA_ID= /DNA_START= /DNA_END= /DNA_ORIENTATION=
MTEFSSMPVVFIVATSEPIELSRSVSVSAAITR